MMSVCVRVVLYFSVFILYSCRLGVLLFFAVSACFILMVVIDDVANTESFSLSRTERLRGKSRIDRLFAEGRGVLVYPFRCVFLVNGQTDNVAVMFSVPKKRFKRAVKRNLVRRRMKEAYRLNKRKIVAAAGGRGLDMSLMYIGNEVFEFGFMQGRLSLLLDKVGSRLNCQG